MVGRQALHAAKGRRRSPSAPQKGMEGVWNDNWPALLTLVRRPRFRLPPQLQSRHTTCTPHALRVPSPHKKRCLGIFHGSCCVSPATGLKSVARPCGTLRYFSAWAVQPQGRTSNRFAARLPRNPIPAGTSRWPRISRPPPKSIWIVTLKHCEGRPRPPAGPSTPRAAGVSRPMVALRWRCATPR